MITLIIDTSTDKSLVIFARGRDLLKNFFLPAGIHSSRDLAKIIATGFQDIKESPVSLKAVAVSVGPGSYTGIRVGVAAAYGLVFPRSLPLISFCSLEGFVSEHSGRFVSVIDARMGGAYILFQEKQGSCVRQLAQPQRVSKEDMEHVFKEYPDQVGPHTGYPNPIHLMHLVADKLEKKEYSNHLDLMYLSTPKYVFGNIFVNVNEPEPEPEKMSH